MALQLGRVAEKLGGEYTVKLESKNALRNALRRFGERLFRGKQDVTAYTFRHAFASDAKSGGLGTVGVAKALGHGSDRMQGRYGHANQSKAGAQSLSVKSSLEPRAERGLQMLKIKTQGIHPPKPT